ncbi:Bug family tripartite tricarboxylate transporter substrate binding protein [Pseudorhodoferax soli]|uniref:Tripartite-type tricarboxylate transporter receptor subunit TctC n=1 Tax=Pseudorhodoferax soli TaxID=545864 RepID=A0A368XMV2_9BURK|nr:tripartite tricarboxylate transporter substrate binding protein [Pseudorhodoferax soli]RCW68506.1 tripartite-type tricarboxylate transporter receptor subunit TctC [Pseudorhodoferax soli]
MTIDHRRRGLVRALPLLAFNAWPARADTTYPDRPVRLVVPFGAGGNVDGVGRLLAHALAPLLGQPVVVDNRPGAGGSLGATTVAKGQADGYTLLVGSNGPLTINPFVQAKLAYGLQDFEPVALAGVVPHVLLVQNELQARSLQDLVALSQRQALSCGSSGVGSATHLTMERLNAATGARLQHVPYRGGNSPVPDLLGGAIQAISMEFSTALPLHRTGKARILAIAAAARSPLAPELPTFGESGAPGFTANSYVGLLAPAATPAAALRKLQALAEQALAAPELVERLQSLGLTAAGPQERQAAAFGAMLRADLERSREAVRVAGIRPE